MNTNAQEKFNRALASAAWSQRHLQDADLDASTRDLHLDNLEHHLKDAKRLQGRLKREQGVQS